MRTISEKEADDKRMDALTRKICQSFHEYVEFFNDVEKRRSKTLEERYMKEQRELINRVHATHFDMSSGIGATPLEVVNSIFNSLDASSEAKPLDGDACPNCNAPFPADICSYQTTMYCPYCGIKVLVRELDPNDMVYPDTEPIATMV